MPRIELEPGQDGFDCDPGDTVLRAALRAGIGFPYSCNVGSCGNCRFELLEGEVAHLRNDPPAWSERDLKRNRWLGCQAVPQGACRIKIRQDADHVPDHRPEQRGAELVSVSRITRDISEFEFAVHGEDEFRPGQYALLEMPGIAGGRPYSMCNLPGEGRWRFQIKRVPDGAATSWLFDTARPGDAVTLDGPYGTAFLKEDSPRDIVLMAGGSGLSPMVSIARAADAAGMLESRKLHFFYGCRDAGDLFDESLLGPALMDRVTYTPALSEPAEGASWQGRTGFLHDVVEADLGPKLGDHEIYFAGPAVMSAAIQKMAHGAGVPMTQLHFDEFY